jgi:predicted Zn-dependent peptidase
MKTALQHFALKNGLEVLCVPHAMTKTVTIMVYVKVGSRYETREVNGASHFIEHLMFKGTKRRPTSLHITKELDRYGAEYNAYTGKDLTVYYIKIDATKTALAIDLLHDMLFKSKYDAEEMDRERGVIVEEIHMYEDNPSSLMEDLLEEIVFPDHPLGWNIAGPKENIRKITREQLVQYRDTHYVPARTTLVVAGNVCADVRDQLEKTFGRVPVPKGALNHTHLAFIPPIRTAPTVTYREKKTEQIQLGLAFLAYPYGDKRVPAARFLAMILGGSMSSRLFTEVREKRGLCYSINASHQSLEDTGIFSVSAGLERERLDAAVQLIWKELRRVADEGVTRDELTRAKDHLRGKMLIHFEDSASQGDWYGKQWVFQRRLQTPEERLVEMDAVKGKEIQAVAKELFTPARLSASLVGPFEERGHVERLFHRLRV